jgi:hypothetical protein
MKLAIVKTCFWLLAHLVVQKDTFAIATNLYVNKQYKESIRICTSQLNKLDMKDTLFEKYLFLRTSGYLESHDYASAIRDCVTLVKIKPQNTGYYVELS